MLECINPLYQQLLQTRQQFFERLQVLEEPQRSFQPEPNQWSMLEVMHHLILVEEYILYSVQKKLEEPSEKLQKKGFLSSLTVFLICLILKFPVKVKVPTDRVKPQRGKTFAELSNQWKHLEEQWTNVSEKFQTNQENCFVFRHPIGGPWTIIQTLQFVPEHIRHHLIQLDRIQQHSKFPAKISS